MFDSKLEKAPSGSKKRYFMRFCNLKSDQTRQRQGGVETPAFRIIFHVNSYSKYVMMKYSYFDMTPTEGRPMRARVIYFIYSARCL